MAKKKTKRKLSKVKRTKKHKSSRKTKPRKKTRFKSGSRRKDKFSMTWDEMKESKEWKADWDDDAGDFEGDSSEY